MRINANEAIRTTRVREDSVKVAKLEGHVTYDWWIVSSELAATRDGIAGAAAFAAAKPEQPPAMHCKKCVRDQWRKDVRNENK